MTRRIAVCDDDPQIARQLARYLDQLRQESGDELDVIYFSSAEELLQFLPADTQVLLLDISMGGMTGMEAARQLRARGLDALQILFITSMAEYALEGYGVHAFAFLTKPVQYAAFRRSLLEVFQRLDKARAATFLLNTGATSHVIRLDELLYAEVYQHETSFVFAQSRQTGKIAIAALEQQIARYGFFRCHKSYLVNLKQILRIEPAAVVLSNGDAVPLSRHRRRELMEAWTRCMGGCL